MNRALRTFGIAFLLQLAPVLAADLQIRFLNVGQGDAILVTTPDGKSMAYDAGRPKDLATNLIQSLGVTRLDLAVASHADADHIGGLEGVATALKPRVFLNNGIAGTTDTYARVIAAMKASGSQGLVATERTINLGSSVKLFVLPPSPDASKDDQNANSVGLLLEYNGFKAFFGGDSERSETSFWASRYKTQLAGVDVYKAAHHGSANNDTPEWLHLLDPSNVVIGVGPNAYGHPSFEALNEYEQAKADVWRTDQHGTVTVTVQADGRYTVTPETGRAGLERSSQSKARSQLEGACQAKCG